MMRKDQGDIVALNLVFDYYRTEVFKKDTQFNMVCRSVILSLQALLAYNKYDDANDFLSDIEYINERLQARRQEYHGNMVRIATVHEFKGKEADSVYIWNDSMDVFPHRDSSGSSEDLQEERRIHYIACTRARKRSTIMSINGSIGLFVQEMDLSDAERIESDYVAQAKGVLKQKSEEQKQMEDNLKAFEEQQLKKINEKLSIKTKEPQKSETTDATADTATNFDDFDEVTFEGIV
jgi:DNA helicase-2/ATP-dependent DNA helicase PcrA